MRITIFPWIFLCNYMFDMTTTKKTPYLSIYPLVLTTGPNHNRTFETKPRKEQKQRGPRQQRHSNFEISKYRNSMVYPFVKAKKHQNGAYYHPLCSSLSTSNVYYHLTFLRKSIRLACSSRSTSSFSSSRF